MPKIKDTIPTTVISDLKNLVACLESDSDIRVCLSIMVPPGLAMKGLVDSYRDPDIMYFLYVANDMLGNVQSVYDGNTEEWYKLNADNVSRMRRAFIVYCKAVLDAIDANNLEQLLVSTKAFFSEFHKLARITTRDRRR